MGSDSGIDTVFRDVVTLALLGFVAMVILMLPHLNPPGESAAARSEPAGNVVMDIDWPADMDVDVDLWVQAPGDVPVGYSNKGGLFVDLLRDDLGNYGDATSINHEVAFSRGIPVGEYIVNVHMFRNTSGRWPVPVQIEIGATANKTKPLQPIAKTAVELKRLGEEITAVRFSLAPDGSLVPDSLHSLQKNLRSAAPPYG